MNSSFWDQRFSEDEPVYGHEPNEFFASELAKLSTGKLLLPAEGQGRNALFAAKQGWEVHAFDYSEVARDYTLTQAAKAGVTIQYTLRDYASLVLEENLYDAVGLVFAHSPAQLRPTIHGKIAQSLQPGRTIILEGFHKTQLPLGTGGPKSEEMLFSEEELIGDFSEWIQDIQIEQKRVTLSEGAYHRGEAEVIRLTGIRK